MLAGLGWCQQEEKSCPAGHCSKFENCSEQFFRSPQGPAFAFFSFSQFRVPICIHFAQHMLFVDKYVKLGVERCTRQEWGARTYGGTGRVRTFYTHRPKLVPFQVLPWALLWLTPAHVHALQPPLTLWKECWVEHLRAASRQSHQAAWTHIPLLPQVVQSRAVNPLSAPWHVATSPSRLVSRLSHPGFPSRASSALPWGSRGGSCGALTNYLWCAVGHLICSAPSVFCTGLASPLGR